MLEIFEFILGVILITNIVFIWFKKEHELGIEKVTKIGRLEVWVGIEQPNQRDFDLTLSWHPTQYFTFQLSLWTTYCGCAWSRDPEMYPDCDHEGVECFYCGCKNCCGIINNNKNRNKKEEKK